MSSDQVDRGCLTLRVLTAAGRGQVCVDRSPWQRLSTSRMIISKRVQIPKRGLLRSSVRFVMDSAFDNSTCFWCVSVYFQTYTCISVPDAEISEIVGEYVNTRCSILDASSTDWIGMSLKKTYCFFLEFDTLCIIYSIKQCIEFQIEFCTHSTCCNTPNLSLPPAKHLRT